MTSADPRAWFPQFYGNTAIRALADACRWTISGQLDNIDPDTPEDSEKAPTRKAPIDVRHLIDGCSPSCRHTGPIRGAWATDATCLVTLEELTAALPTASNAAFYLQAQTDGLLVIDIEKECPESVRNGLLQLPGILYSEVSMSGRGFHLVAELSKNFHDYPAATTKRVLREEHGWYEILLDHWATFTRNPVPQHIWDRGEGTTETPPFASVEELYESLAQQAKRSTDASAAAIKTTDKAPNILFAEDIVKIVVSSARGELREPSHFNHDMSRWEFSVLAILYGYLRTQMNDYLLAGVSYSTNEVTWLLYMAAREVIPHRPKHDQRRHGRAFLLDRAAALVAEREAAARTMA